MILYLENFKDSTKKLLELINEFSNVAGYRINVQKSVVFLNTNNKQPKGEFKKTFPFPGTSKLIKYIGINVTKEVKDLYSENYRTGRKKFKKIQINVRIYIAHGLQGLILSCFIT